MKALKPSSNNPNTETYQKVIRARILLSTCALQLLREHVALSPPRVNERGGEALVQLLAQSSDVNIDHVRERIKVLVPDMLGDLTAGYDHSSSQHKELEKRVLFRRQIDDASAPGYGVTRSVQREVRNLECLWPKLFPPSQQRSNSRKQLFELERLAQVIICPGIKSDHAIVDRVSCGQHQYRAVHSQLTHCTTGFKSVL